MKKNWKSTEDLEWITLENKPKEIGVYPILVQNVFGNYGQGEAYFNGNEFDMSCMEICEDDPIFLIKWANSLDLFTG